MSIMRRNAEFLADPGDLFKGEDVDARVAQRFAIEQFGVGLDRAAIIFGVVGVHQGGFDAQALERINQ